MSLTNRMSAPTQRNWSDLKRLARYLVDKSRIITTYEYQEEPTYVMAYSDSDWADRHSTTGWIVKLAGAAIGYASKRQHSTTTTTPTPHHEDATLTPPPGSTASHSGATGCHVLVNCRGARQARPPHHSPSVALPHRTGPKRPLSLDALVTAQHGVR